MNWAGHIARSEEERDAYRVLVTNMLERDKMEHIGVNERIILKMDLQTEG
jgi:hypothetical protein